MRRFASLLVAASGLSLVAAAGSAAAQTQSDITQTCVDVRIGNDRAASLDCLNDALKRAAEREQRAPVPTVPLDAQSPSNQIGGYNDAAAREHMGDAFGVSATPQRPHQTFVSPLTAH